MPMIGGFGSSSMNSPSGGKGGGIGDQLKKAGGQIDELESDIGMAAGDLSKRVSDIGSSNMSNTSRSFGGSNLPGNSAGFLNTGGK